MYHYFRWVPSALLYGLLYCCITLVMGSRTTKAVFFEALWSLVDGPCERGANIFCPILSSYLGSCLVVLRSLLRSFFVLIEMVSGVLLNMAYRRFGFTIIYC